MRLWSALRVRRRLSVGAMGALPHRPPQWLAACLRVISLRPSSSAAFHSAFSFAMSASSTTTEQCGHCGGALSANAGPSSLYTLMWFATHWYAKFLRGLFLITSRLNQSFFLAVHRKQTPARLTGESIAPPLCAAAQSPPSMVS